jgi:adenylate cyclase
MLNAYLTVMDSEVKGQRGTIGKRMNDAILAVFFPEPGLPHPAGRALAAALAMRTAGEELNRVRQASGQFPIRTDIGLHFGPVIWGKIGSRLGFIDFTVIGDTVNTAARIQTVAGRQERPAIVLSAAVAAFLPSDRSLQPLPSQALKGKSAALDLFAVQGYPDFRRIG